ncbi:MAG TPA: type II toxin-antitoxin system RelE/ParE family toxin [Halobacteriales archaeon]|nr:type II toxin-antitoxin system RelE/ParE family toxin [Halobacteriales archaeon]
MALDVRFTDLARGTLNELDASVRERIVDKLGETVDFPEHFLDPLTSVPGYKLRVGDFRLVVDWDRGDDVLYVVAILRRKHDYRELPGIGEVWGTWRE